MNNKDNGNHAGSILGNPEVANGDMQGAMINIPTGRYATKLDFSRFGGEGVNDWLFRVEQFFILDMIQEGAKINVVSLHLDGCALHWHKNLIKIKRRVSEWAEYKEAIRRKFGLLAYDDPMAEMKKLR